MKLREKFRRFWTMDVHNHEGFTLVELIIVIAILAILSSVAVVGYSSYVEKANKQADMTLIAEIKNVLTLAGYQGTFKNEPTGYIYLNADGVFTMDSTGTKTAIAEGTALHEVLSDSFGSNFASSLKLKHKDWGMSSVGNSTWFQGNNANDLLAEVSGLTDSVLTLFGNYTPEKLYENLFEHMDGDVLAALCEEKGIAIDTSGESPKFADSVTNEQLANLMVLAAAQEITNMGSDGAYDYLTGASEAETSTMTGMVRTFAIINGFANSTYATEEQKQAYEDLLAQLGDGSLTNTSDIGDALDNCMGSFFPDSEEGEELPIDKYFANSMENDMNALVNILGAVSQVSDSISGEDLKDGDFYAKNAAITELLSVYSSAAKSGENCILLAYTFGADGNLFILDSSAK